MATLSVLGLYKWDRTLFDGLVMSLPTPDKIPEYYDHVEGIRLNPDALIDNLLMECAELEVIYPSAPFLKQAITSWSLMKSDEWQRMYNTTFYKYNPLWNKDGTIRRVEKETRDLTNTETTTDNETRNLKSTDNESRDLETNNVEQRNLSITNNETRDLKSTENRNGQITETPNLTQTTEEKVSGYNDNAYNPRSQTTVNTTGTRTESNIVKGDGTDTGTVKRDATDTGKIDRNILETGTVKKDGTETGNVDRSINRNGADKGTVTREYEDIEKGNIGVTTTQQMIEAEREIVKLNIYQYIIDDFKARFCLLVY